MYVTSREEIETRSQLLLSSAIYTTTLYFHVLSCLSYLDDNLSQGGRESVPYCILPAHRPYSY